MSLSRFWQRNSIDYHNLSTKNVRDFRLALKKEIVEMGAVVYSKICLQIGRGSEYHGLITDDQRLIIGVLVFE